MKINSYYKHENGKDAVIKILEIRGDKVICNWYLLDNKGRLNNPVSYKNGQPIRFEHIIGGVEMKNWKLYDERSTKETGNDN